MATHFEVFDKLRDLGMSLDKISNTLPTDNNKEETNKAGARLQLKLLSTEAKTFKKEVAKCIDDAKSHHTLESVLALCQKRAYKIRDEIEKLEDHLTKYGYKRPTEKLPKIPICDSAEELDVETGDQYESRSLWSESSDKENHSPRSEHDETGENTDETHCSPPNLDLVQPPQAEEDDLFATPALPTTFTKLLQDLDPQVGDYTSPETHKEPLPPVTATPLHRSFDGNHGVTTPESLELLTQPPRQTPMVKTVLNFDADCTNEEDNCLADEEDCMLIDFPAPPPPSFSSVVKLNQDDIRTTSRQNTPVAKLQPPAEFELRNKTTYDLPDINFMTYQGLPDCIRGQFSFEEVNLYIRKISDYLNTRSEGNSTLVKDEELITVLQLGTYTRAFVLAMLKLEYFVIKKAGIYHVHSNK